MPPKTNFYYDNWIKAESDWHDDKWRWPNFSIKEIAQRGYGWDSGETPVIIDITFLDKMQLLRCLYGKPMNISSWYRSSAYNAKVSQTGTDGPHTTGKAVDVRCYGEDAQKLLYYALKCEFLGIGISQKGEMDKRFIHLDTARSKAALWSY